MMISFWLSHLGMGCSISWILLCNTVRLLICPWIHRSLFAWCFLLKIDPKWSHRLSNLCLLVLSCYSMFPLSGTWDTWLWTIILMMPICNARLIICLSVQIYLFESFLNVLLLWKLYYSRPIVYACMMPPYGNIIIVVLWASWDRVITDVLNFFWFKTPW